VLLRAMSEKINFEVAIRCNESGETRIYRYDCEPEYADSQEFYWSEGNAACDCNRALHFAWVKEEDDPDRECGDSAYDVVSLKKGGEVIYSEVD
jgi:hypothetical protein